MESYSRTSSASNATLTFLAALDRPACTRSATAPASTAAAPRGSPTSPPSTAAPTCSPDELWFANWNGRASAASDPYVPAGAWAGQTGSTSYAGGHDETYGGVTINIDNDYVEGATWGAGPGAEPKGRLDAVSAPQPGQVTISGWAFDPTVPTQPLAIRAYVGGGPNGGGTPYELGPIAAQERLRQSPSPTVRPARRTASTPPSRSPPAAASASASTPWESAKDRLGPLGCRTVGIRVPISISARQGEPGGRSGSSSPASGRAGRSVPGRSSCAPRPPLQHGQAPRQAGVPRTRTIQARLARRSFELTGGASHAFSVHLSRRGRLLTRGATELRAQLVVAVPGGHKGLGLTLKPGRGLPR